MVPSLPAQPQFLATLTAKQSNVGGIRVGGSVFRGGLKSTRPMCIHPFSGGRPGVARCILRVTGVSRGMTGVSFFSNEQKKVRCIF